MLLWLCLLLLLLCSGASLSVVVLSGACFLPIVARSMHLVVLYRYQGADSDAVQLALTEQLFHAALGELGVVSVEHHQKTLLDWGFSAGIWVDLDAAWALARGSSLLSLVSVLGIPLMVIGGIYGWLYSCCRCGLFL